MAHDLTYVLTVPIGKEHQALLAKLALQDGRTLTGFCRNLLYTHLQEPLPTFLPRLPFPFAVLPLNLVVAAEASESREWIISPVFEPITVTEPGINEWKTYWTLSILHSLHSSQTCLCGCLCLPGGSR